MAVPPTGTYTLRGDTTLGAIGDREDLQDIVYDISPMDTPFMSNIARGKATTVLHEWITDSLDAASANNAVAEGEDATTSTAAAQVRFGNYCQIMQKTPRVSGTLRAVDTAGRRDELSYQISKRSKELKRDIESAFLSANAATSGSATNARKMAGVGTWLWDNQVQIGSGEATTVTVTSGVPTTAPTAASSATAITEDHLKTLLENCWTDGGEPDVVIMGAFNKKGMSAFSGIATLYRDTQGMRPAQIIGAADVYVSDWGEVALVADRFTVADAVYALDLDYWEAAYLRPIQQNDLAKTGDSDRVQLLTEVTLCAKEPKSSGKIFTTTTS